MTSNKANNTTTSSETEAPRSSFSNKETIKAFYSYGLELVMDQGGGGMGFSYQKVDVYTAYAFLNFLVQEMSIYSTDLIKKAKVDKIVLCKEMILKNRSICGMANVVPLPADLNWIRFIFFGKNAIFFDATKLDVDSRCTIHHELFHAIDAFDANFMRLDPAWAQLNRPNFRYNDDFPRVTHQSAESQGFLSDYSMQAVHEDKAELYCNMIVNYTGVEARAQLDPILRAKVNRIKDLTLAFSPEFNEKFWKERELASVHIDYPVK
jgi:hypothetical protein